MIKIKSRIFNAKPFGKPLFGIREKRFLDRNFVDIIGNKRLRAIPKTFSEADRRENLLVQTRILQKNENPNFTVPRKLVTNKRLELEGGVLNSTKFDSFKTQSCTLHLMK